MHIKIISETLILEGPGRFYLDSWYINCASKIPVERGGGGIIQLRKNTPSKNDSLISGFRMLKLYFLVCCFTHIVHGPVES